MASLHDGLDDIMRARLRADFASQLATNQRMPFVIPYCLVGAYIMPTLWLSFSQKHHPWLYNTRWLLAAFVITFNIHIAAVTSSSSIAMSYATGLLAGWGIIYNLNLLVWTHPQATAARIVRRTHIMPNGNEKSITQSTSQITAEEKPSTMRRRDVHHARPDQNIGRVPQADGVSSTEDSKYVWQPFPHDAPWGERLNWAADLTTSFRGCGWNWAISSVPQPKAPSHVQDVTPVDMSTWPMVSKTGYRRFTSKTEFLLKRLGSVAFMYLTIDFLAITMAKDPYFIVGPDHHPGTPPHLSLLPSLFVLWTRQLMSLAAFIAAISGMMTANALLQFHFAPYLIPSRDELWHYPSVNGGFSNVLDRGLAGWWGGWWHQTFRAQFLAPATYLLREGYFRKGEVVSSIVALCITFGQSGMLHAFGSWTSIPETRPWRAPAFFTLQVLGIVIQQALGLFLNRHISTTTKESKTWQFFRCFGNFAFALLWVQWTSIFFCDDIASTGLWLCDPIPFSPLRMLGFGRPGDRWWRWEREHFPGWYTGERWWQSGISF